MVAATVIVAFGSRSACRYEYASSVKGTHEGIFGVSLSSGVGDRQAGGRLVGRSSSLCYTAARYGDGQVVFLLVEVAGGYVDADVAGAVVAGVVQGRGVGVGRVQNGVATIELSSARGSDCGAEDEAFVSSGQGGGVILLVAVAGCNVGAHVAVGAVQRAIHCSTIFGALVQD
ncbi:hypothetical protein D3C71_778200 [compost metagenome]